VSQNDGSATEMAPPDEPPGTVAASDDVEPLLAELPVLNGHGPEAHYSYVSEQGEHLFEVFRFPGKEFRQARLVGDEWVWNLGDVRRPLYRLPRVLAHIASGSREPVFVVEGERDVEAVAAAGGVATCNAGGALKWRPEHSETLQGARRVVVVADRDETGRRHAIQVVESLRSVGVAAELVEAAQGKDAADHLAAGFGLEDFVPVAVELESETAGLEIMPLRALDLDAFLAKPPEPPDWDCHGYYARGDTVLVVGVWGVGKSVDQLARAVKHGTGGGDHLGQALASRRAVFIDLESPEDVVYQRLYGFGLRGRVDGFTYVHRPPGFNLLDPGGVAALRETIIVHRAEIVVIDSARRAAPGLDENDSRQVSVLFNALRELAAELRCTIVVIHHPRKRGNDGREQDAADAARGSGDLLASVDSYLFYRRLGDGLVRIEHGKARRGGEHEHVHFRIVEGDDGGPVIEHVSLEPKATYEQLVADVVSFVQDHPGACNADIEKGVHAGRERVRNARDVAASHKLIARGPGRHPGGKYWYPANQAENVSPGDTPATLGDMSPAVSQGQVVAGSPPTRREGESSGGDTLDTPDEQAEEVAYYEQAARLALNEVGSDA
jgi:5S rRNA maturation endonuclease (ribonuclease M5)